MFRPVRWPLVMSLLLLPALLASASGAGSRTMDYAWLLFLKVNEPPQIDAVWADSDVIAWPTSSVLLDAAVTDDPRDTLAFEWAELDGVEFVDRFAKQTTATFTTYGSYSLELSVTDNGGLTSTSIVTVTYNNSAPNVDAGQDKQTKAPDNSVDLDATVTDNTKDTLTYQWTIVSGPTNGIATFVHPKSVDTTVTFNKTGDYVLKLWASDGELSNADTVTVKYLPVPVNKIDVIRAVGDSITEGIGDGDGTGDSSCKYYSDSGRYISNSCAGYTPKLQSLINNRGDYADGVKIYENGYPGETSAEGLSRIQNIVQWTPKADQYLVLFGTNDSCGSSAESPAGFKSNMRKIVEAIKGAGSEPVLAKVPYAKGGCYSDYLIREYNKAINALVAEKSLRVVPLDFYGWYCGHQGEIWSTRIDQKATYENGYTTYKDDNVHPKEKDSVHGYWSMAKRWRDCLLDDSTCKYYVKSYKSTCDML